MPRMIVSASKKWEALYISTNKEALEKLMAKGNYFEAGGRNVFLHAWQKSCKRLGTAPRRSATSISTVPSCWSAKQRSTRDA